MSLSPTGCTRGPDSHARFLSVRYGVRVGVPVPPSLTFLQDLEEWPPSPLSVRPDPGERGAPTPPAVRTWGDPPQAPSRFSPQALGKWGARSTETGRGFGVGGAYRGHAPRVFALRIGHGASRSRLPLFLLYFEP
jgi:hypothetical protein